MSRQCSTRLGEEAPLGAEAGVRPGGVEPAVVLQRNGDRGLLIGPLGHVALDRDGVVGAAELLRERIEPVDRTSREHEPPALGGEEAGGRGTDARRGTGDQDDAVAIAHAADSIAADQPAVGSGSAPQLAGTAGPGRLSTRAASSPSGVAKVTRSPCVGDEPQVADTVTPRHCAHGDLGGLYRRPEDGAAAIEVERDPALLEQPGHLGRPLERDPPQLDSVREHEHVRREPVAAEVRRLPQPLRR